MKGAKYENVVAFLSIIIIIIVGRVASVKTCDMLLSPRKICRSPNLQR